MSLTSALIDSREPAWVQALTFGTAMAAVTKLEYGDLMATTDDKALLLIERKTANDLLGSIRDGRLWPQIAGMRKQTPWVYVVVTGELRCSESGYAITSRGETQWAWASVQGALLKAQELGAMVAFARDDDDFEATVLHISARSHNEQELIKPAKTGQTLTDGEQILVSLPGIGQERLEALLGYTSRPCWALTFLTCLNSDEKVAGIAEGTKQRIRAALQLEDTEELWVANVGENKPVEGQPK